MGEKATVVSLVYFFIYSQSVYIFVFAGIFRVCPTTHGVKWPGGQDPKLNTI
jgi:hypothetical protein